LVGTKLIQPQGISSMLQGVILFIVIGTELLFHYRIELEKVETVPVPIPNNGELPTESESQAEASHDR